MLFLIKQRNLGHNQVRYYVCYIIAGWVRSSRRSREFICRQNYFTAFMTCIDIKQLYSQNKMGHRITWRDKDSRRNSNVTRTFFIKFCLHSFSSLNAGLISFSHGWQIPYKCVSFQDHISRSETKGQLIKGQLFHQKH